MAIRFGTVIDPRDGKAYRTVLMPDGKWWTAENLAWDGAGVDYDNDPANRAIYGRLYSWGDAMAHKIPGTRLATGSEGANLLSLISPQSGVKLRTADLWESGGGGSNIYGFSLRPAGVFLGYFRWITSTSDFWIGSDRSDAKSIEVNYERDDAEVFDYAGTGDSSLFSVRLIVESGNFEDPTPLDGITFTPKVVETPFKCESRNLRRFFVQGVPVFETSLKFHAIESEEQLMNLWLDNIGVGSFSRANFPVGNADTVFQILEPPSRDFSHSGMLVTMKVVATQDVAPTLPYPIGKGQIMVLPVCCPFPIAGQGSMSVETQQLTVATGGRSTARAYLQARGSVFEMTYGTDRDGLAQFMSWWHTFTKCGHRGFFASIDGYTSWYFEFVEQPRFSLTDDFGKVSAKILGRDVGKSVTLSNRPLKKASTSTHDFVSTSISAKIVIVDMKGELVDLALYSVSNILSLLRLMLSGVPAGQYRYAAVSAGGMSPWYPLEVTP